MPDRRQNGGTAGKRQRRTEAADRMARYAALGAALLLALALLSQSLLSFDGISRFLSAAERLEGEPCPVVPFLHPPP